MTTNAPLNDISSQIERPHVTARKPLDRRQTRSTPRTAKERLRILCHIQGLLIEALTEKAANGNA
jgi:hypothetical protein